MESDGKFRKIRATLGRVSRAPQLASLPVNRMAARTRRALAKRVAETGIPVKVLAHDAPCSEKTVRNFLNGDAVRDETVKQICAAARVKIEIASVRKAPVIESSDQLHGPYSKEQVLDYIGHFFAYRRSFFDENTFIKSFYTFQWDEALRRLRFQESQNYQSKRLQRRVSYDQDGDVFISNSIGSVHLLTVSAGALRLITLTRLHPEQSVMRGAVLTQAEWPDHYQPAVSPIYFRKVAPIEADVSELTRRLGPVEPGDPDHEHIRQSLDYAQNDVVNFRYNPS